VQTDIIARRSLIPVAITGMTWYKWTKF